MQISKHWVDKLGVHPVTNLSSKLIGVERA